MIHPAKPDDSYFWGGGVSHPPQVSPLYKAIINVNDKAFGVLKYFPKYLYI